LAFQLLCGRASAVGAHIAPPNKNHFIILSRKCKRAQNRRPSFSARSPETNDAENALRTMELTEKAYESYRKKTMVSA
jgi:hypothetical protein